MENKKRRKFNTLDFVIVAIILAVAVFFSWRYLTKAPTVSNFKEITFTAYVECVPVESYNNIIAHVPDKMVAAGKYIDGTIVSVTAEPCDVTSLEMTDPSNSVLKSVIKPDGDYVRLTFKLKANVDTNTLLTQLGTQEIRVGRAFIIKSKYFEFTSTVISVDRAD